MGATARIMAYLGLDNSPFTRVLDQTVVAGEQAAKGLERSFGAHHIFKGILQGMGIGSIEGMVRAIQSPFKRGAEEAERAARTSETMGDITFKSLAGFDNLQQKLSATRAEIKGMPVELAFAEKAVKNLDSGFTGMAKWANPETMSMLTAAGEKIDGIKVKTAQLQAEETKITQELALQAREMDRQLEKIDRAVELFGKSQIAQVDEHFKRAGQLRDEAAQPGLTDSERKSLTLEAEQEFAAGRIGFKQLALQQEAQADKMRELDRKAAELRETSGEKIVALRADEAFYAARAADSARTEAQRAEDAAKARELGIAADQLQVQRAIERRGIEDQIRQIQQETAALGETKGEQILRLKRDAAFHDQRSFDFSRTEKERDADHVRAAQLSAQAAREEYEWKNRALGVDEAARGGGTYRTGVAARQIQRNQTLADQARAQGRYDAALHYDTLARSGMEQFEQADRAGRQASADRAANPLAPGSWDARYASQMAVRNARLSIPGDRGATASSTSSGAVELKSAAGDLKAAAAELKNVQLTVDVD